MKGFAGESAKDMCIQKAYGILKKRGFKHPMSPGIYWHLRGVLDREGEQALYNYAKSIAFDNEKGEFYHENK